MRRLVVLLAILVVLAGCNGEGEETTTSTESGSTTAAPSTTTAETTSTSTEAPPSTTDASTTTNAETTTTTQESTTTTVTERPVTEDPNLPSALGGHLVDWDAVGPGWILTLYDANDIVSATSGPIVLYLVSPSGDRYEVASWVAALGPYEILDWAGTGDDAMVMFNADTAAIVDLHTGVETATVSLSMGTYGTPASFTSPTGTNVVVAANDGTNERVERRDRSGSVLAVLGDQPIPTDYRHSLEWLYGYDGTFALIKHAGGIEYVQNDGSFVRDLWTPMGQTCTPVRWWDADTFVSACAGEGPAWPHEHYFQLWLLKTDGTAGSPLTTIPPGPVDVVNFGHHDAWLTPGKVVAQWWGDCGSAAVDEVAPDGSFAVVVGSNSQFVEIDDSGMVIQQWVACDMSEGRLFRADLAGVETMELVPRVGDSWGVRDAATLSAVYP